MYCKNCGNQIDDNAYVCVHCGVKVSDDVPLVRCENPKFCTHCGKQIDPNAYICVHCGVKTNLDEGRAGKTGRTAKAGRANTNITWAIVSIVVSILTLTILGAVFSIVGMTKSLNSNDAKGIKFNGIAIAVCVLFSLLLILGL